MPFAPKWVGNAQNQMRISHSLLLPRDAVTVPAVRHLCRTAMSGLGITESDIDDVTLALTEACANVVEHAAAGENEYQVDISIAVDSCEITVVDRGDGFDADDVFTSLESAVDRERGRGLPLMRSLVDVAELSSRPSRGTVVRLIKYLTLSEDAVLRRIGGRSAGR